MIKITPLPPIKSVIRIFFLLCFLLFLPAHLLFSQTTYYVRVAGNWSNINTWSTASCGGVAAATIPSLGDDIQMCNGKTLTVDGNYTCRNFTLGSANLNETCQITNSANSLTITGDLKINSTVQNKIFILDAGPGTINIAGTFTTWGTWGTNSIRVSTGTINFTPAITIAALQDITMRDAGTLNFNGLVTQTSNFGTLSNTTAAGTINFNSGYTHSNGVFTTLAGETINIGGNFRNTAGALTLNPASTAVFNANAPIITPTASITFGHFQIVNGITVTLAGNISVAGNWTNDNSTLAGNFGVIFNGTGLRTITRLGGETFYNLTVNTTGPLTMDNDVIVTNALTMTSGNINLNSNTLQLGNGSGASLTYTTGTVYSGFFKRYIPALTNIISTGAVPRYGLFPIGISTAYRPIEINSTAQASIGGYITANHTNSNSVTDVSYSDNQSVAIERISDMKSTLSTTLIDGTYNLDVTFNDFNAGTAGNLRLETLAGSPPGVGNHAATGGTDPTAPVLKRTNLSAVDLTNDFVAGTTNKTNTPIKRLYYARVSGDWTTAANWRTDACGGTVIPGSAPGATDNVVICAGIQINIPNSSQACMDLTVYGTLNYNFNQTLTVNGNVILDGVGVITQTSGGSPNLNVSGSFSVLPTATDARLGGVDCDIIGITYIDGYFSFDVSSAGNKIFRNNIIISSTGTLDNTRGEDPYINGNILNNGSWIGCTGGTCNYSFGREIVGNYTISGNPITMSRISIYTTGGVGSTLTNLGTVIIDGTSASCIRNRNGGPSSTFNNGNGTTNALLYLSGTSTDPIDFTDLIFNATSSNNTVYYSNASAQNIAQPSDGSYFNLVCLNGGTKTIFDATVSVSNHLLIKDNTILDVNTNQLNGTGGLTMQNTSDLQIAKLATVPELTGTYTLTAGTVTLDGAGAQRLNTTPYGATACYNLLLTNSGTKNILGLLTINNNLTVAGAATILSTTPGHSAFTQVPTGTFTYSSSATTTLSAADIIIGNFNMPAGTLGTLIDFARKITVRGSSWNIDAGTFTATGTVEFDASTTVTGASATTFNNVTINSTKTLIAHATNMNVKGANWINNGIFTHNSGMVTFTGVSTTAQGTATTIFNHLTITGTLLGHSTNMEVQGNWLTTGATFTHNSGTVTFTGGNAQTMTKAGGIEIFNNLVVNKTAGTTLTNNIPTSRIYTKLTMTEGIFDISTNTLNTAAGGGAAGDFDATGGDLKISKLATVPELSGAYNLTGGTVTLYGAGAQILTTSANQNTYYNVILTGSGAKEINSLPAGIFINGDFTISGTAYIDGTTGGVQNPSITQNAAKTFYYTSTSATATAFESSKNISIGSYQQSAGTLNINTITLTVLGTTWNQTAGTFSPSGTVVFQGGSAQTYFGSSNFKNLIINNINNVSLSSNITVDGATTGILTFTSGNIVTGTTNNVIIQNGASVSRTSGHVDGNLQKWILAGSPSLTYEVGTGADYSNVDITFASVTAANYLTCSAISGDHTDIFASDLDPNKTVNRYWTFSNSGVVFTTYDAVFNFVAGDKDPGVDYSSFIINRYDGVLWSIMTAGIKNSLNTQMTGCNTFTNNFQIGEKYNSNDIYNAVTGAMIWNDAANWIRYKFGSITCSTLSPTVNGSGTKFLSEVSPGDVLSLRSSPSTIIGTVLNVIDDVTLTLSGNALTDQPIGIPFGEKDLPALTDVVNIGNTYLTTAAVLVTLDITPVAIYRLKFTSMGWSNNLTHNAAKVLNLTSNADIAQPNAAGLNNSWNINNGRAIVAGNLTIGSAIDNTQIAKVVVTSDTLKILNNLVFNGFAARPTTAELNLNGSVVNLAGALTLRNAVTGGRIIHGASGSTFNYNRNSGTQVVTLYNPGIVYNNLHINTIDGATLSLAPYDILINTNNVTGNLKIQSGKLSISTGKTITGTNTKTFEVVSGATFEMTGTVGFPTGFTTWTFGANSNTKYLQTTNPLTITNIASPGYGNLYCQPSITAIHNPAAGLGTFFVQGDLVIGNGTNTTTVDFNTNDPIVSVGRDVILTSSNSTLNLSATAGKDISLGRNWTNNSGIFNHNSRTVTFNGTVNQQINGTAGSQTFFDVIVNKTTAGTTLTAGGSTTTVTISNNLSLPGTNVSNFTAPALLDINGTLTLTGGTFTGGSNITIAGSWTNNGGTYTHNNGTVKFDGSVAQNITGTSTIQTFYDLIVANTGLSPIAVSATSLANLTCNNFTLNDGDFSAPNVAPRVMNINGNFYLQSPNAGIYTPYTTTNIKGNITYDAGTLSWGTDVNLTGSILQNINGILTIPNFTNLEINNTTKESAIKLNKPIDITGVLKLTDGHIISDATNLLTLDDNATVNYNAAAGEGTQDSSFVKGPVKCIESATGAPVTKYFPVGKGKYIHKAELTINQSVAGVYTGEYFESSATALGWTLPGTLDWVSGKGYWDINKVSGTVAAANVNLYYNAADEVTIAADLRVAKGNPNTWIDINGSGTGVPSGSISSTVNFTTFSYFSLANKKGGTGNPLPVSMLDFTATCENGFVNCQWTTITEINNDYFDLQRSFDAEKWEHVATIKGAGNSNSILNYKYSDKATENGLIYYRLIQHDYDGKKTIFNTVTASCESKEDFCNIVIYPNPARNVLNMLLSSSIEDIGYIYIFDEIGNCFYSKSVTISPETSKVSIDITYLSIGSYYVKFIFNKLNPSTYKFAHVER